MSDETSHVADAKVRKITAGFIISWILAVLFGIPGILMLFEGKALEGILFILAALIIFPPFNTWMAKSMKVHLSGMLKAIIFVILIVIAGFIGTSASGSPSTVAVTTATTTQAVEQTALQVSASTLAEAYDNNEVSADTQYKGKLVDVSGTIDTIGKDITGTPYVSLKTGEYETTEVECMFSQATESSLESLSSGQTVTLEGTVAGKPFDVEVDGCSIVSQS